MRKDIEYMSAENPLMESIGSIGFYIGLILIVVLVALISLIVISVVQLGKYRKLKEKYDLFMSGKNAKSLEKDIMKLFEDNKIITEEQEKARKDIRDLNKRLEYCYQKIGLVKYDAFHQMGGKMSFCLCLLNDKNNGFLLNSVHSSDGCYSYTKEISKGECELELGDEEKEALDAAIGY